ncbi:MAG: hypothetical protein ACYC1C_20430, partial [Chloroflexota bacterium]
MRQEQVRTKASSREGEMAEEGRGFAATGPLGWSLAYLGLIAVTEYVIAAVSPQVGVLMQALLLFILIAHGATAPDQKWRAVLWALVLVPLARLLSLSLPWPGLPTVYWYVVVGLPLAVGALMAARVLGYTPQELGIRLPRYSLLRAVVAIPLGLAIGLLDYVFLGTDPLVGRF